jgi:hypothetical protein
MTFMQTKQLKGSRQREEENGGGKKGAEIKVPLPSLFQPEGSTGLSRRFCFFVEGCGGTHVCLNTRAQRIFVPEYAVICEVL